MGAQNLAHSPVFDPVTIQETPQRVVILTTLSRSARKEKDGLKMWNEEIAQIMNEK